MRNVIQDVLAQGRALWARLDAGQRLVVTAVTVATVVGLGTLVWFAGRPSYETVFTAKTGDEVTRVKAALQTAGVAYNIGDSGKSFLVERGKIGMAQAAIAEAGLTGVETPAIGGGLSLIEDSETKAFKLDAAARAGAVAAIQQLDGVIQATVTASRPRKQPAFRDRDAEQRASATVVLRLRPNVSFDALARAASSIASSQLMVPQANIEVVSTTGSQRFRYDPDRESAAGTSEFLSLQRSLSDERTRLAQERLDQLWPGKTSVAVTVELDPSWEIRSEKVVPAEQLVSSESVTKDSTSGAPAAAGDAASQSRNETRERKFVTEIGERRVGKAMHEVKRMSVAVLFDRSLEQQQGFAEAELVATVKAIVGWDPQRDQPEAFSTMAADFAPLEPPAAADGPGLAEVALRWGPTVGQVLGVLVVVLFLRGLFQRSRKAPAAAAPAPAADALDETLSPEEQQKRMRREIERSIANDPAALAKLLETWIVEQKA